MVYDVEPVVAGCNDVDLWDVDSPTSVAWPAADVDACPLK